MKTYKESDLRELYRICNKYWKTGDTDLLPAAIQVAEFIDNKEWDCVKNLVDFAARTHRPIETAISAFELFGYKALEEVKDD